MTVIKRGKSYWIDIGFNRKRIRKRSPDNSFNGAKVYEAVLRQKLARGEPIEDTKPNNKNTFKEISLKWLETYVKNNNKPSEYVNKRYIINSNLIPFFGNKYIDEIRPYEIENYKSSMLNKCKLSPKSINNYLSILSRCLRSAHEWGLIKNVPRIKLLKVPPQKYDYLTERETEQLLKFAKGMWFDLILLAVRTGLRFGELIALKWEDVNFKEHYLTVNRNIVRDIEGSPKNNKSRIIPLTGRVLEMLKNREKKYKYIFHDKLGNPLKYSYCRDSLQEICKAACLRKISWHVLRHSFASHLTTRKNSIVAIKELMGHSDIKTTMRLSLIHI